MDGAAHGIELPQPHVSPDAFEAYVEEANSYAVDALKAARREANGWRWGFVSMAAATAALGLSLAVLAGRHTEHWGILIADPVTGTTRVLQDIRDVKMDLPASVDNWFLERYVQMREGWNDADADAAFQAVACMSDPDEQARFAEWYNNARTAPQQVFARAHRGWRDVTVTSSATTDGMTAGGARRVAVPFSWQDKGLNAASPVVTGTARFTVRKDKQAIQPCNPVGIVISAYARPLDREPTP